MKKSILALSFWCLTFVTYGQDKTFSGTVTDATNGETLLGVNLYTDGVNRTGAMSNEYGFYSIDIPEGASKLFISYVGYQQKVIEVKTLNGDLLNIKLFPVTETLDEVIVQANSSVTNIKAPQMSVNKLSAKRIKEMPAMMGEVDVIQSLQLLPGVTNSGEASSGFNVRGGAVDQNLVLLDEAPLYNTSHFFGLFSVFNADAIKDVTLYKGGIPASYGGRVSSVLDVRQKDGNNQEIKGSGGISIISSRLALEGPIKKNKGSFLIAGRATYAGLLLRLSDNKNRIGFYDLNAKGSYTLNKHNKVFLSGYFGNDNFEINQLLSNQYGNATVNLRWNHIFSNKIFSNLSTIYNQYYYNLGIDFFNVDWNSSIENVNLKYDLNYYLNAHWKIQTGFNGLYYKFNPGEITAKGGSSSITPTQLALKRAFEPALYASVKNTIGERFEMEYGLRYSGFLRLGGQSLNTYENNEPLLFNPSIGIYERANPNGIEDFGKKDVIKTFQGLEPRFGASYLLNDNTSLKVSYQRTNQYIHLISNTISPNPIDIWAPSGRFIKPQRSNQYAIGFFKNFKDDAYSLEIEGYFKNIDNQVDYIDGANLIGTNTLETEILQGEMRAYGAEILLKKNRGRFTGWLSYTLAKSEQRVEGRNPLETGINNGQWYSTPFDRRHDLSITGLYKIDDKWRASANFIYQTGRPTTFPTGRFDFDNLSVPIYSARNDERLSAYHRLDISITYDPTEKKGRFWDGEWVLSVYNAYARKNASSINFSENETTENNEARQFSIFGTFIPTLTYNFTF